MVRKEGWGALLFVPLGHLDQAVALHTMRDARVSGRMC